VLYQPSSFVYTLAKETLETYNKDKSENNALDTPILNLYSLILKDILNNQITKNDTDKLNILYTKYLGSEIVQQNIHLIEVLQNLFVNDIQDPQFTVIQDRIKNSVIYQKSLKCTKQLFKKLQQCGNSSDSYVQEKLLDEVKSTLNEMQTIFGDVRTVNNDSKNIDHLDFSDKESIKKVIKKFTKQKGAFVFKTGLQALNKMLGEPGGLVLGHSIVFGACSHNYKSGMLLSMVKWIAKYNAVPNDSEGKIPTIWFITLENEVDENVMIWYKQIYREIYEENPKKKSNEEIVDFVYEFFNKSGWRIIVDRKLGNSYGVNEFTMDYEQYEKEGCRIYCVLIDYLSKMKKDTSLPDYLGIRAIYNTLCNYTKNKGTSLITCAQLSREAMNLRKGAHAVKKFNETHISDSLAVYQEVDILNWINLEKNQYNQVFLTMAFGKNRYYHNVPEVHKYAAWKFEIYGIPDDINGEDTSVKNIYSVDPPDIPMDQNHDLSPVLDESYF
jgi:hypothetical protein